MTPSGTPRRLPDGPSGGRVAAFQGDQVYVLTARNGYAPLMIGEFTVDHAKRNQMRLTLGRSNTAATVPRGDVDAGGPPEPGRGLCLRRFDDGRSRDLRPGFHGPPGRGGRAAALLPRDQRRHAGDPATLSAFKIVDMTTDPDAEAASSLVPQTIDGQQAYAYVDYAYAGPADNDPPTLSSPQVNPATGRPGVTYTFTVRYTDQDGNVPSVKNVVVDGTPHAMTLVSGQMPANGVYSYAMTLALGSHSFYFYFEDGHGESALAPLAGEMRGPEVYTHVLTSLSPSSAAAGDPAFTLALTGSDFVSGVVVTWDGSDRPTTFVSSTRLDAQIGAADLASGKSGPGRRPGHRGLEQQHHDVHRQQPPAVVDLGLAGRGERGRDGAGPDPARDGVRSELARASERHRQDDDVCRRNGGPGRALGPGPRGRRGIRGDRRQPRPVRRRVRRA